MGLAVSIIIPVYNVEKYLADCLDSVLNQTEPFDEIIVINDGATDGSGEICRSYQLKNPRIQLIEQENRGLSAARNVGLEAAKGDYIIFLDSDDMISPKTCEIIKKEIEDKGILDVVYYASDIIKEIPTVFSDEGYCINSRMTEMIWSGFDALKKIFPESYWMGACMSAYRRVFLKENDINFIQGIFYEDRFFSLRVITEAESVIYLQEKLYIRRFRAGSIITSPSSRKKIEDVLYGHKAEWNYIKKSDKWTKDKGLTQYYVLCGFYMAFQGDVSSGKEEKERSIYALHFWNVWFSYFDISVMSLNSLALMLFALQHTEKNWAAEDFKNNFQSQKKYSQYKEKVKNLLIEKCKERLEVLPFKHKICVGIYGIGRNAECMLGLYQMMIGDIKSDLYFILSQDGGQKEYNEHEVRAVTNLYQDTEYIIVSSKVYRTDMCKRLDSVSFDRDKVIVLHNENDAVDFVMISKLLQTV